MAMTFETTAVTWTTAGTTTVPAAASITSDDITLDSDAIERQIFVSLDSGSGQAYGDVVTLYWQEKSGSLYTNQMTYLGTLDVYSDDPANKSFGLFSAMSTGRLVATGEQTVTCDITANLHERSTA